MNIRVRVEVTREPDERFYDLINSIHSTFTENILDELTNAPKPLETGEFQQAWASHREDIHNTVIYNDTPQARYLQGTGMWGPNHRCHAREAGYWWRAASRRGVGPIRGINPHRIAQSINEETLAIRNVQAQHREIGWDVDDYKQDTYDFIEEMNNAISKGVARARRELEGEGVEVRES